MQKKFCRVLWCVIYVCKKSNVCCYLHCYSCISGRVAGGSGSACLCVIHRALSFLFSDFLSLWETFKQLMSLSVCGLVVVLWVWFFFLSCVWIPFRCVLFLCKLFYLIAVAWFYYLFNRLLAVSNSQILAYNIFWLCQMTQPFMHVR